MQDVASEQKLFQTGRQCGHLLPKHLSTFSLWRASRLFFCKWFLICRGQYEPMYNTNLLKNTFPLHYAENPYKNQVHMQWEDFTRSISDFSENIFTLSTNAASCCCSVLNMSEICSFIHIFLLNLGSWSKLSVCLGEYVENTTIVFHCCDKPCVS